ncbi:MAG: hypothetical protein ACLUD0_01435 [Eubacterium ramulus]
MSMEHYHLQRPGKKTYKHGLHETYVEMPALDAILEHIDIGGRSPLGLVDIPTDSLSVQRPVGAPTSNFALTDPYGKHRVG